MLDPTLHALTRRGFLKIAGAAALVGCSKADIPRSLMPYLVPPEHIVPGKPLFYRTVCRECPAGCGVTARTREGRAVKLEGNPEDPIGRGSLCARGQAALQGLYDPDRLQGPMRRGADGTWTKIGWDDAIAAVAQAIGSAREKGSPPRVRLLTRPEPGSAGDAQRGFMAALGAPAANRVVLDPFDIPAIRKAGEILFGRAEMPAYDLASARSVVSFGADFVETWLSPVELARGLASGRGRIGEERTRTTWIGPRLGLTGVIADAWLPARAGSEKLVALGILRWLCDPSNAVPGLAPEAGSLFAALSSVKIDDIVKVSGVEAPAIAKLARELADRRPSALLGPGVSSATSAGTQLAVAIQLINYVLGNIGRTVLYGLDPALDPPSTQAELRSLVEAMASGSVDVLLIHHADPVGALPAAIGAAAAMGHVPLVVSFSGRLDATSQLAHLILPDNHPLEAIGDLSTRRGIVALAQPAMTPLWDTRNASQTLADIVAKVASPAAPMPFDKYGVWIQSRALKSLSSVAEEEQETARRSAFSHGGIYAKVEAQPVSLRMPPADLLQVGYTDPMRSRDLIPPSDVIDTKEGKTPLAIDLLCFPTTLRYDGRGMHQTWLREVPDTVTTISWSSWAELSPKTAAQLGVIDGDLLEIGTVVAHTKLPVYIYPGLRDDVVAVPLGSVEPLAILPVETDPRSAGLAWLSIRALVLPTGDRAPLPRLEGTPYQDGREIVRTVSSAAPVLSRPPAPETMYKTPLHPKHRWGMAIDLDRCTGCQACIVACYAENNIPVNGPEFALAGRNMAWLRVERYFGGEPGEPVEPGDLNVDLLLMLCQQCTNAPCETVCPTYATYHTDEGLNAQVYNRCVGTRYCANNCPYKVRSFNWRDATFKPPLDYQLNPDVTVRSKGVMEKCTFCVQRIRAVEIDAEGRKAPVRDGEITPACAQTCPTQAIVFGDTLDPSSRLAALQREGRAYRALEDLNTQPAITYLARVREKKA